MVQNREARCSQGDTRLISGRRSSRCLLMTVAMAQSGLARKSEMIGEKPRSLRSMMALHVVRLGLEAVTSAAAALLAFQHRHTNPKLISARREST